MCKLLKRMIPEQWLDKRVITIKDGENVDLDAEWFACFWKYLCRHVHEELIVFEGLPVLPLSIDYPIQIVPLQRPAKVFITSDMGCTLPPSVQLFLKRIGCIMAESLPPDVSIHSAVKSNYVLLPMPMFVIDAIVSQAKTQQVHRKQFFDDAMEGLSPADITELRQYLATHDTFSKAEATVMRCIPVFETFSKKLVCGNGEYAAAPIGVDLPFQSFKSELINLNMPGSDVFARKIGLNDVGITKLLLDVVIPNICQSELETETVDAIALFVLENFTTLSNDDALKQLLIETPFIATSKGSYKRPKDLYDPKIDILQKVFCGQDVFPHQKYRSDVCISSLIKLGMDNGTDIKPCNLLQTAKDIADLYSNSDDSGISEDHIVELTGRATSILEILNKSPTLLQKIIDEKPLWEQLKDVAWVPALTERPTDYPSTLPFYSCNAFVQPSDICLPQYCLLIGSNTPVISTILLKGHSNPLVNQAFGWQQHPKLSNVVLQLTSVIENYHSSEKAEYLKVIVSLYDSLQKYYFLSDVLKVLDDLDITSWVWNGDGFVEPKRVTLAVPFVDLKPYIWPIQPELLNVQNFLLNSGVLKDCTYEHYLRIMHELATDDIIVDDMKKIELSVSILNKLGELNIDDNLKMVPIPIKTNDSNVYATKPLEQCTYCDTEWLRKGYSDIIFEGNDDEIFFIHPNISIKTAESLRVRALISRILHVEDFGLTGFGQQESLTDRLHGILNDYTDGFAVPKELIQNADDAGASEVIFIYDERHNRDHMKYLLDENMRSCQGPALWVYNNAIFTDTDFQNISKLGSGSKANDYNKIGQFGLGFNAVYNLTDVPSIMSREFLAYFDPHYSHLGRAIQHQTKAGIMIDLNKNQSLIKSMPDQFYPYQNILGTNLESSDAYFDGTLIRLPLRSYTEAQRSEISNLCYDKPEMIQLLNMILEGVDNILLFTSNIKTIKLYHIAETETDPSNFTELLSFTKHIDDVTKPSTVSSKQTMKRHIMDGLTACRQGDNSVNAVVYGELLSMNKAVSTECVELLKLKTKTQLHTQEQWLTSYSSGKSTAMNYAAQHVDEHLLPFAATAVPVEVLEDRKMVPLPTKGALFCHLPIARTTGLPVHINATFSIQSNRRDLVAQNTDDKFNVRADWNVALMVDAIPDAYINLLQALFIFAPANSNVFNIWPLHQQLLSSNSKTLQRFVHSFYLLVSQQPSFIISASNGQLITLQDAIFLERRLLSNRDIGQSACKLFQQTFPENAVFGMTNEIIECFKKADLKTFITDKIYNTRRFFEKVVFPQTDGMEDQMRNNFIIYGLTKSFEELKDLLENNACIPTGTDPIQLRTPDQLVNPHAMIGNLYEAADQRLPLPPFDTVDILEILSKIGLQRYVLKWYDVVERAHSIEKLYLESTEKATDRLTKWLKCVSYKLKGNTNVDVESEETISSRAQLSMTKFLPILVKPDTCPLPWKSEEYIDCPALTPLELFQQQHIHLISVNRPIIGIKMESEVETFLQIQTDINPLDVITQLDNVISNDFHDDAHITAIYTFLNTLCADDKQFAGAMLDKLESRKCILIDNKFVSANSVSVTFSGDADPYLYKLPYDYRTKYKHLMMSLGVKNTFEMKDFVTTLAEIHTNTEDKQLDKRQMDVCSVILVEFDKLIHNQDKNISEITEECGPIYMPNGMNILKPHTDLLYNDSMKTTAPSAKSKYTHPSIPLTVAQHLEVPMLRKQMTSRLSKGIPFGQKEPLPNILKRILLNYPRNLDILKELVQNSDDAGATEIKFIRDYRNHSTNHVFSESWKPLQGPALCVYNNQAFSDSDIECIQRVGDSDKLLDPAKTGQYGIGFNSVYHLTDVPTLLTHSKQYGDKMCIFDPNCAYIPESTVAEPGRRFDDEELMDVLAEFKDIHKSHLQDINKFSADVNHTLFRFPLRSVEMARKSSISQEPVSPNQMNDILKDFAANAFDMLLFTNSLKRISLNSIDSTGEPKDDYVVVAKLNSEDENKRNDFFSEVKVIARKVKEKLMHIVDIPKVHTNYIVTISDSSGITEKWHVFQALGFCNDVELPLEVKSAYDRGEFLLMPRGSVACLLERRKFEIPCRDYRPCKAFCFLPLPIETGLPVQINAHFSMSYENRHCLPTEGMGAKWNHLLYKEILAPLYNELLLSLRNVPPSSSNISNYYKSKDMLHTELSVMQTFFPSFNKDRQEWNLLTQELYSYMNSHCEYLIPVINECSEMSEHGTLTKQWLVEWLPSNGQGDEKVFFALPEDKESEPPENEASGSSFLGRMKNMFNVRKTEKQPEKKDILKELLFKCGFKVAFATTQFLLNIREADISIHFMSSAGVIEFFRSYSSEHPTCHMEKLPIALRKSPFKDIATYKTIIEFCKEDEDFFTKLQGLPLLLTADESLRVFDAQTPIYKSECYTLFTEYKKDFLHEYLRISVFDEIDPKHCEVLKPYTIEDLSEMLSSHLSQELFKSQVLAKWSDAVLNQYWIRLLWRYVASEIHSQLKAMLIVDRSDKDTHIFTIEELDVVVQAMRPLESWCLVPVKFQDAKMLHMYTREPSIVDTRSLLKTVNYETRTKLKEVFVKFQIPELDSTTLTDSSTYICDFLLKLPIVATLDKPVNVLKVLHGQHAKSQQLKHAEANTLLCYFNENIDELMEEDCSSISCIAMLKDLPCYLTVYNELISVTNCFVYVIPSEIPTSDMDVWKSKSVTVFLANDPRLEALYKQIDCKFIEVIDVYCDFILKHFEYLSNDARMDHMKYIYETFLGDDDPVNHCLMGTLEQLPFIEDEDGECHQASEYYDPENTLFSVMMPDEKLPPNRIGSFKQSDWYCLLRKLGMKSTTTDDLFVEFASSVEALGTQSNNPRAQAQSKQLIEHLVKEHDPINDAALYQQVSNIKFVCLDDASTTLTDICPQYQKYENEPLPYSQFQNSVPKEFEGVVWTTAPILPTWFTAAVIQSKYQQSDIYKELGIRGTPLLSDVIINLKKLVERVQEDPAFYNANCYEIFKNIYRYLKLNALGDDDCIKQLARLPFIMLLNYQTMVFAKSTVMNMTVQDEIKPNLYKIPHELGEFHDLFEKVGTTEQVTRSQYAAVLRGIYHSSDKAKLHPNECKDCYKALHGFFSAPEQTCDSGEPFLCLLSEHRQMVQVTDIVFNDVPAYYNRLNEGNEINFMMDLKHCGLAQNNIDTTIKKLPKTWRPQLLSDVVSERLDTDAVDQSESGVAGRLGLHLRSASFTNGVVRLIQHKCFQDDKPLSDEDIYTVVDSLSTIKVRCAEICIIYLQHDQKMCDLYFLIIVM